MTKNHNLTILKLPLMSCKKKKCHFNIIVVKNCKIYYREKNNVFLVLSNLGHDFFLKGGV